MSSKPDLNRQLKKVQFLSPESRKLLQEAIRNCPENELEMLAAVIDRADKAAGKIETAYHEKRVTLLDNLLTQFD